MDPTPSTAPAETDTPPDELASLTLPTGADPAAQVRGVERRMLIDFWIAIAPNRKARRRRQSQLRKARGLAPDAYLRVERDVYRAYLSWRAAREQSKAEQRAL